MSALAYSRETAADATSFSVDEIDRAIRTGELAARKRGRRTIILAGDLDAWLNGFNAFEPKASA